jgi:hypothetical protein
VGLSRDTNMSAGNTRRKKRHDDRTYSVYVIRLDDRVLSVKRFRERNPQHRPGRPCAYVGMTFCSPDERLKQHLAGYKACRYVKKYGKHLMRRQFAKLNPMTWQKAKRMEVELAQRLRQRGYAVWQN